MEKIATDIYSFEKLRRGGYVYVDKTDFLWRLVSEAEYRRAGVRGVESAVIF